jgi:hypothetical protein
VTGVAAVGLSFFQISYSHITKAHRQEIAGLGNPPANLQRDDEKAVRRVVAAGSPRHISVDFDARWRGKPATTTFFIILLGHKSGSVKLTGQP